MVNVDLSRDEDSVTSLAVAHSSDTSATVFAGINSSEAEQQAGKNEHLRSFKLEYPPRKKARTSSDEAPNETIKGETKALGRASLFTPSTESKKETYQRVLRVSRQRKDDVTRAGVVATGLAPAGEVVVFDASTDTPNKGSICGRIQLGRSEEAADVDIIEGKDGGHQVAYCTDYEVYLYSLYQGSKDGASRPRFLYSTPHPDVFSSSKKNRPKFRSLRFLTSNLLVLVQNLANRSGAEVLLLDIPRSAVSGNIVLRKRLHRSVKSATALTTSLLPSPSPNQNIQHAIGIAGQDISITILTLDHNPSKPPRSLKLRQHSVLRSVHPLQMTALTFSTFTLPATDSTPVPQYLKLASVSMGATVIVHTLPLTPYPPPSAHAATPRYVLAFPGPSETAQLGFSVLVSIIVVGLGAFLLQAFTEIRGGTPEYLGAKGWLSKGLHDYLARPYMFENGTVDMPVLSERMPPVERVREVTDEVTRVVEDAVQSAQSAVSENTIRGLRALLSQRSKDQAETNPDATQTTKAIVVRDESTALSAEVRQSTDAVVPEGTRWEELEEDVKEGWKRRLEEAGEWTVAEGEAVLKGVFFSGLARVVGEAVARA